MYGEFAFELPEMPAVTIALLDQSSYDSRNTLRDDGQEWYNECLFQIDCYSNRATGRKEQAKQLMQAADTAMLQMGFERQGPIPLSQPDYYRYTATYAAVVSHNHTIYRR